MPVLPPLRALAMVAPLLASPAAAVVATSTTTSLEPLPEHTTPSLVQDAGEATEPIIPEEDVPLDAVADATVALDEVRWTVRASTTVERVAVHWGLFERTLRDLNPQLAGRDTVEPGEKLQVFRSSPANKTQSVGRPNRGRLRHGIPLPEGDGWELRVHRPRAYGTQATITNLVRAFEAYRARYPEGQAIRVGEISRRGGGKARPHLSHRTGRDVDIGYVLTEPHRERFWRTAKEHNFDAEKNWFLIKSLIDSGQVQQIYMSGRLQNLMLPYAEKDLSPEELTRMFRSHQSDWSQPTLIRHWKGHRDHMHVRFRCEDGNNRCRSRSWSSGH